jgi:tetratricopeptide (TPR) repeat protein
MTKSKSKQQVISFEALSVGQWMFLTVFFFLIVVALWQSFLPLLAERRYRDGFNAGVLKQNRESVNQLELAVGYAPWETQYMTDLSKSYEALAMEQPTFEQRMFFLNKALEIARRAESLDQMNPWFKNRIAIVYEQYAQLDPVKKEMYLGLAEKYHRLSAKTDSQNPLFQLNLGFYLHQHGKPDEAIIYYKKTTEMDNGLAPAHFNLADIYLQRKQYDMALREYLSVDSKNPAYGEILFGVINVYLMQQNFAKAREYLEEAYRLYPDRLPILQNLLAIYQQQHVLAPAIPVYETMFRRFPREMPAYHAAYIQTLFQLKDYDRALRSLSLYLTMFPGDSRAVAQQSALQALARNKS